MKKLIAVYGTLKRRHGNHRVMGKSKFLGEVKTEPKFTMYSTGGFPILSSQGDTSIAIEVFEVTEPETLRRIYGLEGYSGVRNSRDNWYDTIDIPTPWGDAEIFIQDKQTTLPIVTSGVWE